MKKIIFTTVTMLALVLTGCSSSEVDKYVEKSTFQYDLDNIENVESSEDYYNYKLLGKPKNAKSDDFLADSILYDDKNKISQISLTYHPKNEGSYLELELFEKELNVLCDYILDSSFDEKVVDEIKTLVRKHIMNPDYLPHEFEPEAENSIGEDFETDDDYGYSYINTMEIKGDKKNIVCLRLYAENKINLFIQLNRNND